MERVIHGRKGRKGDCGGTIKKVPATMTTGTAVKTTLRQPSSRFSPPQHAVLARTCRMRSSGRGRAILDSLNLPAPQVRLNCCPAARISANITSTARSIKRLGEERLLAHAPHRRLCLGRLRPPKFPPLLRQSGNRFRHCSQVVRVRLSRFRRRQALRLVAQARSPAQPACCRPAERRQAVAWRCQLRRRGSRLIISRPSHRGCHMPSSRRRSERCRSTSSSSDSTLR